MIIGLDKINNISSNAQLKTNNDLDEKIDFENAISKLNVDSKSILIMKFYLNFTFEEVANSMEKPTSTIKTWYYKALEDLRQLLENSSKEVHVE